MDDNQRTFETRDVVRFYAGSTALQRAEERILELLGPSLATMKMLDVGIGGGRTTRHIAARVREYVGVDYARAMVDAARRELPGHTFEHADVRDLSRWDDGAFDFVLASFNCVDYVPANDREKALSELRRVTAPGGRFAFSTHNLGNVPDLFRFRPSLNPVANVERALKVARLHLHLRRDGDSVASLCARPSAVINDGSYRFRARTYYVRPSAQMKELERLGFGDVRIFAPHTGEEIAPERCDDATDPWLYFLCAATP